MFDTFCAQPEELENKTFKSNCGAFGGADGGRLNPKSPQRLHRAEPTTLRSPGPAGEGRNIIFGTLFGGGGDQQMVESSSTMVSNWPTNGQELSDTFPRTNVRPFFDHCLTIV